VATAPKAEKIKLKVEDLKGKDLRSVALPFTWGPYTWYNPPTAPPGTYYGYNPITLITTFTAQRTYVLTSARYTFAGGHGNSATLRVGLSPNPAAYAGGSVGVELINCVLRLKQFEESTVQEFINWDPYVWYLPIGSTISILGELWAFPWELSWIYGVVQLYLMETFEQG
jgi:hypothetical protein